MRKRFLDGLRGIAAFWVVIHHALLEHNIVRHRGLALPARWSGDSGRFAVDLFIVLSGFSLMLGIARSRREDRFSVLRFLRRRAWRILPPYYGALAISLLFIAIIPGLNIHRDTHWDITLPAFTRGALISHLLLVQNLSEQWVYKINHALWTVATECQIYILFILILLPIWRRAGTTALLGSALLFGAISFYAFPAIQPARPWYIGLFTMGMAAAIVNSGDAPAGTVRRHLPWGIVSPICFGLVLISLTQYAFIKQHSWLVDYLVGGGCASLILCLSDPQPNSNWRWLMEILESKPLVWLGLISYSLYLIHPPVIAAVNAIYQRTGGSFHRDQLVLSAASVIASVIAGWAFFLGVERWFIPAGDPRKAATSHAAPV